MLTTRLQRLTHPGTKQPRICWISLSFTFAVIYGILGLQQAFQGEYVVQDDVRQHVFWMQRFVDPGLFPNDLIADYFQSVAPAGYTALYRLMAVGIHPLLFNKILPPILGVITTGYCFGVSLQLLPIPATAFMASLLLNQALWMDDGLSSATPRAFIYPIFLAFVYYLLRRALVPCVVAIALMGLFYPQYVFICVGLLVLRLFKWEKPGIRLASRRDCWLCAAGVGVAFLVLLPYAVSTSQFGPTVTAAQARTMPEFFEGGRANFFGEYDWNFWLSHPRGGLYPRRQDQPLLLGAGLLLPVLFLFPRRFPLVKQVKETALLWQLPAVALTLFLLAHALLFKLHLPSRYTKHSWRIVLALAAAIALTALVDAVFQFCQQRKQERRQVWAIGTTALVGTALIFYPFFVSNFLKTLYEVGTVPELYQFFSRQPQDSLIASLSQEANFLPTFARRSILVGREYGIPYHLGYYSQFRRRSLDLLQAQYSPNIAEVQHFIQKYDIDFWLLEAGDFTSEYIENNRWLKQYPQATDAQARLNQGVVPALVGVKETCSVFETQGFVVLDADCISSIPSN